MEVTGEPLVVIPDPTLTPPVRKGTRPPEGTGGPPAQGNARAARTPLPPAAGGPGGPAGPAGPGGPASPARPCGPCAPAGPAGPAGPCGPIIPCGPATFHTTRVSLFLQVAFWATSLISPLLLL